MDYSIGFAQREINPFKGISLVGYDRSSLLFGTCNDGILDSLYVKVLLVDDGKRKCVLIVYDLLGLDSEIVRRIKKDICKIDERLEPTDILIAATHTHSGPAAMNFIPKDWIRNREYNEYLVTQTLSAFEEAIKNKHSAKFSNAVTSCNWNKYRHNEREVNTDHEVTVIRIDTQTKTIILFTYPCHPVILLTSKVSSDYVGYARKTIEDAKISGKETFSIFFNECSGNINPYSPHANIDLSAKSVDTAITMGCALGKAVNEILTETTELKVTPILTRLQSIRTLNKVINGVTTKHPVEIQLFGVASLKFVTIPGEPFVETGLWIKERHGKSTIPIGYANENIGYIPTPEYFQDPKDALYEVRIAGETVYGINIPQDLEPQIRETVNSLLND